ncbi:zinc finger BED domain-containing protein RICESLEEPER 2-like [Papaver somniferum]|uniref:zinc finger BED domain-containing protein RICESLEEPER 2-like n=1 Tax=Papaver somniferum TaxID=3469 RepID=UPI000E6FE0B7|nr:zinc finger BED domain-containing protein RICESLEEPER 2-like [Papaver somniferum]
MTENDGATGVTGVAETTTQITGQKRNRTSTVRTGSSDVWTHMKRFYDDVDGVKKFNGSCVCEYCGKKFNCPSENGTSTFWAHLRKRCSKYPYSEKDKNQKMISLSGSKLTNWKFDQVKLLHKPCKHVYKAGVSKRWLCTITLDNAKCNGTAINSLMKRLKGKDVLLLEGEFFHVRCFAHVINLVVEDGVKDVKPLLKRLRWHVKYVRSSPSRLQIFKECAANEGITTNKYLCSDVKMRWNSTFLMISSALQFPKAFERMAEQDVSYRHEFEANGMGQLEEDDWKVLNSLNTFLEKFYLITMRISGSHYTTSNFYFDELSVVKESILEHLGGADPFLSSMAKKMNEKFEKYCSVGSVNPILIVAMALDPRYKFHYAEFWYTRYFKKIDASLSEGQIKEKVTDFVGESKLLMLRLYLQYKQESDDFKDNDASQQFVETDDITSSGTATKSGFSAFLSQRESVQAMNDYDRYLNDGAEPMTRDLDVLCWWKGKVQTYHAFAIMARDILTVPITSVPSECAFSTAKRVLDAFRSSMKPKTVECLICAQDWLKNSMEPIGMEGKAETLDDNEKVPF